MNMNESTIGWISWAARLLHRLLLSQDTKGRLPPGAKVTVMELGSGYQTPQPPAGLKESRDLAHLHPELRKRYELLKADFQVQTGCRLKETCTWRSKERQQELYQVGRRGRPGEKPVTNADGVTKKSRHNVYPAEALDVAVVLKTGQITWESAGYKPLGPLAAKHGLTWGGNWTFKDEPHIELPATLA